MSKPAFSIAVAGGVCRVCGCTDADCRQCIAAQGGPCAWEDAGHTLCTRCANEIDDAANQRRTARRGLIGGWF